MQRDSLRCSHWYGADWPTNMAAKIKKIKIGKNAFFVCAFFPLNDDRCNKSEVKAWHQGFDSEQDEHLRHFRYK